MNKVYFCNNGFFDPRAMLTFGVSVKDEGSIGYFGTGFKYAIAIILRNGGSITIRSGDDVYDFKKVTEIIRDKEVDLIYCNGENAGFTTHMGINWKSWMACRELYSNCIDEGGKVNECGGDFDTVIEVNHPEIYEAYLNTDSYFIGDDTPLVSGIHADIHRKRSAFVYYKGVAVYPANTFFTYNI